MVIGYLSLSGLTVSETLINTALQQLEQHLESGITASAVWQYQIPELGEGGSCSLFGQLQDTPFEIEQFINKVPENQSSLDLLQSIVNYVVEHTGVEWFGIYSEVLTSEGPQLLKLAYHGAPSRPLFPLTEAFAQISNNVQVALSGKARVINNVASYVADGGEYYTCDPKVQAEACLPMFHNESGCIGIVDAEAFQKDIFSEQVLAILIAACIKIPQYLPKQ